MNTASLDAVKLHAFNRANGKCECVIRGCNHPKRGYLESNCKNKLVWEDPNGWNVKELDTDKELTMDNSILLCVDCVKTSNSTF